MTPDIESHCYIIIGFIDVVHSPEWFKARRKISPDEVVITVGIAGVLLRGVVDTRVGGVLWGILLLAKDSF